MRALRILTAVTLLSVVAGASRADGLLYQLPKDGSWVAFDFQANTERRSGVKLNRKGTFYMSSVGRTTEGDDVCRWIEFSFEGTREFEGTRAKINPIYKVLIPEKYLKKGENPVEHIVRGYRKGPYGDDVRKVEVPTRIPYLQSWLAGPLEEVEKLDKEVVESKLGKLECEGLTGSTVYNWPFRQREVETQSTIHIRLHKKAPFGVVSIHKKSENTTLDGKPTSTSTSTLTLSDFGEDAESELPDHN